MKLLVPATLAFGVAIAAMATVPFAHRPVDATLPPVETVTVAPGSFAFRLPGEYLKGGWPVDAPMRTVAFKRGFEIMKYQVRAADYAQCVADGACEPPDTRGADSADMPMTGVSFRDATAYTSWLSGKTGENWRLPTDEEWAYAAAERLHDDALGLPQDSANPAERWLARYRAEAGTGGRDAEPKPLGYFGANAKGLADVAGNVWEWTTTCYLRATVADDGKLTQGTENCGVRVVGGRHRGYMSNFIRDGKSGGCAAGIAPDNLGIRLIRDAPSLLSTFKTFWARTAG